MSILEDLPGKKIQVSKVHKPRQGDSWYVDKIGDMRCQVKLPYSQPHTRFWPKNCGLRVCL